MKERKRNKFIVSKSGKMSDENIGKEEYKHLGLRLVTNIIPDISYKLPLTWCCPSWKF